MKKYITVAALLAAGTAFANAAIETWAEIDGSASLETPVSFGTSNFPRGWDVEGSGLNWQSGNAESVVFTIDATKIDSTNSYTLLSIVDGTYNGLAGVSIADGNLNFVNWAPTSALVKSVEWATLSTAEDLTFVLSRSSTNAMSLSVYADGAFGTPVANIDGKSNFVFSTSTSAPTEWTILNFGAAGTGYHSPVDLVMPADANVSPYTLLGAGYIVGSEATVEDLNTYYIKAVDPTAVVPEPSAFGLLAGIGALALVASRRRRKA